MPAAPGGTWPSPRYPSGIPSVPPALNTKSSAKHVGRIDERSLRGEPDCLDQRRLPELGGETPVETVLRDAHALGFEGIELGGKFSRDPVQLGKQLNACTSSR